MLVIATFLVNSALNFAVGLVVASFLGPTSFGQYAIAASLAIVMNALFLDWIRFAATRYYSNSSRETDPSIRNNLDALFLLFSLLLLVVAGIGLLSGLNFGLMTALAMCAPAMAICNCLFDYHAALARARFEEKTYSLLVGVKSLLAFILMVGGAWWFNSPVIVAVGFMVASIGTIALLRHRLKDDNTKLGLPEGPKARLFFFYGFPVVAAALLYFTIPLINRTLIAQNLGFAASGQFSLAYDTTLKLVQTIAAALDVLLFQLAIQKSHDGNPKEAEAQVLRNIGIVFAILAVCCTGLWLILPSFEALLVPRAYHGTFRELSTLLLPGIFCYALIQAATTPVLQLTGRTWPAILAGLLALMINLMLIAFYQKTATVSDFAMAFSIACGVAAVAAFLQALSSIRSLPSLRDLAIGIGTSAAMVLAVWPIRAMPPGLVTMLLSLVVGGTVALVLFWVFNLAGLKPIIQQKLSRSRAK